MTATTSDAEPRFRAGKQWCYRAPAGFEASRILIGAVVAFADRPAIVCCAVTGAPRLLPGGTIDAVTIPFLPMSEAALAESVITPDGEALLPPDFAEAFELWREDDRGLAAFTVPFEGRLDLMIARQMAAIVGHDLDEA